MQNKDQIREDIQSKLQNMVAKNKDLRNALLLVHSNRHDLHWNFSAGTSGVEHQPVAPDNPYHIASIGKTFTSMVTAKLYEDGVLNLNDPISKYLSSKELEGLFVHRGTDHSQEVLVRHLLNHKSGVADYYEDKPAKGKPGKQVMVEDPKRFWKPDDTLDYTRNNLKAVSAPGKKFHYSDTGYNLLGKIIEKSTGRPFHENLYTMIFDPLRMENSYFPFYSEPRVKNPHPLAETFIGDHEVSTYTSISMDWAGGGIISTTEDLLRFHQALVGNTLVKRETFELWCSDLGRFGHGMDYGYGILFLNIDQLTFIYPKELNMWGNFGAIAAYMFYNPAYDFYMIGSFNHSNYVVRQVFFLIELIRSLSKMVR